MDWKSLFFYVVLSRSDHFRRLWCVRYPVHQIRLKLFFTNKKLILLWLIEFKFEQLFSRDSIFMFIIVSFEKRLGLMLFLKTLLKEINDIIGYFSICRILVETKDMLEDQLATSRRRAEQVLDLENTILQLKQQLSYLNIVSIFPEYKKEISYLQIVTLPECLFKKKSWYFGYDTVWICYMIWIWIKVNMDMWHVFKKVKFEDLLVNLTPRRNETGSKVNHW